MSKVVINGGDLLPNNDCFSSWEDANEWAEKQKYNLDGPVLSVVSRFYPPKEFYGENWDGKLHVYVLGRERYSLMFTEKTLEKLKKEIKLLAKRLVECIMSATSGKVSESEN